MSIPLVSVITPVYNGADHLAKCIESVISQTYPRWEHHIVDNASSDETAAIAARYAAAYPDRIFVHRMEEFLPIIPNHNRAVQCASRDAGYIKMVFADDRIYPDCLRLMVEAASASPEVGLVCSYATDGANVMYQGWANDGSLFSSIPGKEMCRQVLLGRLNVFGTATSAMYRADLVRKRNPFFQCDNLHADHEVCVDLLLESDMAFVHQILSYHCKREASMNSWASQYNTYALGGLTILAKYGSKLLAKEEFESCLRKSLAAHHRTLALNALRIRRRDFWDYHRRRLLQLGLRIDPWKLAGSVVAEIVSRCLRPIDSAAAIWHYWWRRTGSVRPAR